MQPYYIRMKNRQAVSAAIEALLDAPGGAEFSVRSVGETASIIIDNTRDWGIVGRVNKYYQQTFRARCLQWLWSFSMKPTIERKDEESSCDMLKQTQSWVDRVADDAAIAALHAQVSDNENEVRRVIREYIGTYSVSETDKARARDLAWTIYRQKIRKTLWRRKCTTSKR